MSGTEVREIAGHILMASHLLEEEAKQCRTADATRMALFLETIATGLRENAFKLVRAFPPSSSGSPLGDDDPTPTRGGPAS